ncbi:MAG: Gfo/Idh/MocA family oxidoreductase [Clostridiales bacterium]|jgi:predicted dehydrogenase|nr:Gfo/Idh/MocA family oxidoreductase [Clostridiales bacterium]
MYGGNLVSILLVGIGGWGNTYVDALLSNLGRGDFRIAGAVDPNPQNCNNLDKLNEMGIPIFSSMEEFYAVSKADLTVVSSPIHFHCEQTCTALAQGSNVLCEKPVSATIQEARQMIEARDKAGKIVAVGYQWSYSNAIRELKKDIQCGLFGRPKRFKTIVLWPRDKSYYRRGWAGRIRDTQGRWILDSVANNATGHHLHNMLYVLGGNEDVSAKPACLTAELYRANNIENFDTAAVRIVTQDDVELLFYVTHAVLETINPTFCFEFEKAKVMYGAMSDTGKNIVAVFDDESRKDYGSPDINGMNKLWMTIDAVKGLQPVICGIEAASSQTICINGMQEAVPQIPYFPENLVRYDEDTGIAWVEGLNDILKMCYREWKLPHETGVSWAKAGRKMGLDKYDYFMGEGIE